MRTLCARSSVVLAGLSLVAGAALAGPFSRGSLVVMLVNSDQAGSGAVSLAEYSREGVDLANQIDLPTSGAGVISSPQATNHDRHVHLSTDKRFATFVGYGGAPGATDYSGFPAATYPRVVGLAKFDGTVDLSTRLTTSYDVTSIRGAFTSDGTKIWLAGDNAGGAVVTGGLRFATIGASSSVNLSQVQTTGQAKTPDNVRDLNVFDGQLYDCSGSDTSIGKGVFVVGTGLPETGSQTLSPRLNGPDGASTSSFYLLDMDPSEPGVDVLYTASSAAGIGVHKYVKSGGVWTAKGFTGFPGIEQVIALANPDGSATIFAGGSSGIARIEDAAPLTATFSGSVSSFLITPPAGYTFGGIDFAPKSPCPSDVDNSGEVDLADFFLFFNAFDQSLIAADVDENGEVDLGDFFAFFNGFDASC